ncbi:MAG TPA: winged helix DNA-binding domain-containing protein, partial [Polyangiales bacterium]
MSPRARTLGYAELARLRLRSQRLIGPRCPSPVDTVEWFGALQAQDYAGAKWAVGQRTRAGTDAQLERALDDGAILRTHVLRPTWHFVAASDLRALLQLSAARVHAASVYVNRRVKLDDKTFAKGHAIFSQALRGGREQTRTELGRALAQGGIHADGLRLGQLIMHAELEALLCSGRRRGKQFTYALLDERAAKPKPIAREHALALLTERYFQSHGPALARDFAWWSGSTLAEANAGIELIAARLESIELDRKRYWFVPRSTSVPKSPSLQLLPNYDEYLVAYRDRALTIGAQFPPPMAAGHNPLGNSVVLDGRVVANFRRIQAKAEVVIEVGRSSAPIALLQKALDAYAEFLAQ